MADKLVETGWAYPCFCTEEELIAKREQVMVEQLRSVDSYESLVEVRLFVTFVCATCHFAGMVFVGALRC